MRKSVMPRLEGSVRVPGDKSIAHRALLLAALSDGPSSLQDVPDGLDVRATRDCLAQLGVRFEDWQEGLRVVPAERFADGLTLDSRNSGTTARLLAGALAGRGCRATIVGDASLSRRPMDRVAEPLRALGADVRATDGRLPLHVAPAPLTGTTWEAQVPSSQVKSAFLLAALGAPGESVHRESLRTRDHMERLLPLFGVPSRRDTGEVRMLGPARPNGSKLRIPGDPSSAAVLVAAATLLPDSEIAIEGVDLNPTRLGFARVLGRMGADLTISTSRGDGPESVGTLRARHAELSGTRVPREEAPSVVDELPLLVLCAAFADGESRFEGLGELRHKESDRLAAVLGMLRGLGVEHALDGDDLTLTGRPGGARRGNGAASIEIGGDHRLAMLDAVLALRTGRPVLRHDSVAVSWPGFHEALDALTR